MKKNILFFLLLTTLSSALYAQKITIAAAADLRFALTELKSEYQKENKNVELDLVFGSSGNLFTQISNSAPFDLFFSADSDYPAKLVAKGLVRGVPKVYAIGHLVLFSSSLDVSKGLQLLSSTGVKKIAVANPDVAPYGKRAIEALKYYGLYESINSKIVKGENVAQAAQFVLTGNADCGLIAQSLALSPEMVSKGKFYTIDEKSYSKLEQSYVVLKQTKFAKEIDAFLNFINSSKGKAIFVKFGFTLPNGK